MIDVEIMLFLHHFLTINTGKNNRFPISDILGYLKKPQKSQIWQSKTSPNQGIANQVPSLVGTCLTIPKLGFLWVFFKYPKTSKNGNLLFFPVKVAAYHVRVLFLSSSDSLLFYDVM